MSYFHTSTVYNCYRTKPNLTTLFRAILSVPNGQRPFSVLTYILHKNLVAYAKTNQVSLSTNFRRIWGS